MIKRKMTHTNMSEATHDLLSKIDYDAVMKLDTVLLERGLSQTDLSKMTGIRTATINGIINFKKESVNIAHLIAIMVALDITNIREIFDVEFGGE